MRAVAVTGAAGYIGRAACELLLSKGVAVHAIVRHQSDRARLPTGVRVFAVGDLSKTDNFGDSLKQCDAVIHLAARATAANRSRTKGMAAYGENPLMVESAFRAAERSGVKRFVYVSSVKAVAERSDGIALSERDRPHPTEAYGKSKLLGEERLRELGPDSSVETVIMRPPLVYGPARAGNFRALVTLANIAHRIPLPLGGIQNRRSLVFVANLADALATVASHPAAAGETFFVSDGPAVSTSELILAAGTASGKYAKLFHLPSAVVRIASALPVIGAKVQKLYSSLEIDDARLRTLTGWAPPFTFEQAMALSVGAAPLVSAESRA